MGAQKTKLPFFI